MKQLAYRIVTLFILTGSALSSAYAHNGAHSVNGFENIVHALSNPHHAAPAVITVLLVLLAVLLSKVIPATLKTRNRTQKPGRKK